jgi:hypothetical protein
MAMFSIGKLVGAESLKVTAAPPLCVWERVVMSSCAVQSLELRPSPDSLPHREVGFRRAQGSPFPQWVG